ncbi:MAG: DUF4111 domain-containing protein [Oligoflexia bacterium]|nr:DUF4111 domain-containing protein [Oligoflexia bacterium]
MDFNNQDQILDSLVYVLGEKILGIYLTGSLLKCGSMPLSDVDLLVITKDSISKLERRNLIDKLLPLSAYPPIANGLQPLEVTVVAYSDIYPWRYPVKRDFIYGEWLRSSFEKGELSLPSMEPDLTIVLAGALESHKKLVGGDLEAFVSTIPMTDIRRAIGDSLTTLISYLNGDERNVILTMARMVVTLETGAFVSKHEAADYVKARLSAAERDLLGLVSDVYLGRRSDEDWSIKSSFAQSLVISLEKMIRMELAKHSSAHKY